MIRWLRTLVIRSWRHDHAFTQRMWRAFDDATEQSRISLEEQEQLRLQRDRDRARLSGGLDLDDANEAVFGRPRPSRRGRDA